MRPVRYLFDENTALLFEGAIRRRSPSTELLRVGQPGAPPFGTEDPDLLVWCEEACAIFVTIDRSTLPVHVADHYKKGRRIWGVFTLDLEASISQALEDLLTVAGASSAEDWLDRFDYLPFRWPAPSH